MTGPDTIEELNSIRKELVEILDSAGLVLFKWATNCELLGELNQSTDVSVEKHEDTKALGLVWNPKKLEWDDPVPDILQQKWQAITVGLEEMDILQIPRHAGTHKNTACQIHGFANASSEAYGCSLYIRVEHPHGVEVKLLTAKLIVAPLKTKSVPRL